MAFSLRRFSACFLRRCSSTYESWMFRSSSVLTLISWLYSPHFAEAEASCCCVFKSSVKACSYLFARASACFPRRCSFESLCCKSLSSVAFSFRGFVLLSDTFLRLCSISSSWANLEISWFFYYDKKMYLFVESS